jgi:hypothetical protein
MHLFRGSLHSCIWELFVTWILVVLFCWWCRAILPHLEESASLEHSISVMSSCCPCLRGPRIFSLSSDLVLAFVWLLIICLSYSFIFSFFSFLWIGYYVCCQCTHQGEIEDRNVRGSVDGCSWLWWVINNVVWTDSWPSITGAGWAWFVLVQVKIGRERSLPCGASKEWRDK